MVLIEASEHSLFTCEADDFVRPEAVMTQFDREVAQQGEMPRDVFALSAVAAAHHAFVTGNEAESDLLRAYTYILTEVEQHPWLFVVRDPRGETTLFHAPVKNAAEFHAWVYSAGKQAVLDIVNEIVAEDPESFAEYVSENGLRVSLH